MSCIASDTNEGFFMETWSGNRSPKKILICDIDKDEIKHIVYIINDKTYKRDVFVKGINDSKNNRAKFQGPNFIVKNDDLWEDSKTIYSVPRPDRWYFERAALSKKSSGPEEIKVEIEYEDSWNPNNRFRADQDSYPLVFTINLL